MPREQGGAPTFDEVAAYLGLTETQKGLVAKAHRASQLKLESSLGDDRPLVSEDVDRRDRESRGGCSRA